MKSKVKFMNNKKIIILIILLVAFVSITVVNMLINNDNNKVQTTFTATVLENKGTSIMVQPDEEDELRTSDKIVVRLPKDKAVLEDLSQFSVGRKVKITYDGTIMESYPAQINATKVELN